MELKTISFHVFNLVVTMRSIRLTTPGSEAIHLIDLPFIPTQGPQGRRSRSIPNNPLQQIYQGNSKSGSCSNINDNTWLDLLPESDAKRTDSADWRRVHRLVCNIICDWNRSTNSVV
jgi:hypothetical protein